MKFTTGARAIAMLGVLGAAAAPAATLAMDSDRGEQLFSKLACIGCHSVNGQGGKAAPDLGQRGDRDFTPATLASTMWNHAPVMWAAMRSRGVAPGDLDEQAAADLFAYFYAARFFDRPGDAGRGKAAFAEKHCADCHGVNDSKRAGAKPISQWQMADQPVALVNEMWNHAATMRAAQSKKDLETGAGRIRWPELNSQQLTDILVYVRSVARETGGKESPGKLILTTGGNGEALFMSKGCASCHNGKNSLEGKLQQQTLTDIAVDMWNHAPRMGSSPPSLTLDEMRDIASFLWAQQFFADQGSPTAGRHVFVAKRCASCHEDASRQGAPGGAPKLTGSGRMFSGAGMVSVLWRHGPQMLEQMNSRNIQWPRFNGSDMSNLIAYLNSERAAK